MDSSTAEPPEKPMCISTYTYICTCIYVYTYVYTCIYVYTYMYTCIYVYTYVYQGGKAQRH